MGELFLRQSEAWDFIRSIQDPTVRLLTEVALGNAFSFLASDPQYRAEFSLAPLDALTYARAISAFVKNKQVLADILSGTVKSIDDLGPFPKP
jgi:hypothetical protein